MRTIVHSLLVVFMLVLDQFTKEVILKKFVYGESIPVIQGFFNLTYVRNTGAAFGFLADSHPEFRVPFFYAVPLIALGIISRMYLKLPKEEKTVSTGLALVCSGALGNLIDRIRHGYVVDFLDFHWNYSAHFPAFNVADSCITVGMVLVLVDSCFPSSSKSAA